MYSNVVEGNYIGTNVSGTGAVPNGTNGVSLEFAFNNTIGGNTTGAGNLISGNTGDGISITNAISTGNLVVGNDIGTEGGGNGAGGVVVEDGAAGNTIGGITSGAGNTIAYNLGNGVTVGSGNRDTGSVGNEIEGNSITANTGLGISLAGGTTPITNDSLGHSGPNDFQDFPTLTSVASSSAATSLTGTFDEAAEPDTTLLIAFYSDPTADPSQYGQGASLPGHDDDRHQWVRPSLAVHGLRADPLGRPCARR